MKSASFGIILKNNQILLCKRVDVPVWVLPGGGIEPGETPENACIREVFEETGVKALIIRKSQELYPVNKLTLLTHLFVGQTEDDPHQNSTESSDNQFFNLNQLPKELFWVHKHWIDEALSSQDLIKRDLNEITWFQIFLYLVKNPWQVIRFGWTRFTKN